MIYNVEDDGMPEVVGFVKEENAFARWWHGYPKFVRYEKQNGKWVVIGRAETVEALRDTHSDSGDECKCGRCQ